jgi:hypothetical protein
MPTTRWRGALAAAVTHLALHAVCAVGSAGWSGRSAPSCAARCKAREAGYDGVEVMGSEGYFINQFLSRPPTTAATPGAATMPTACACRWRSCPHPRGGGAGLHPDLPPVDDRPGARRQLAGTRCHQLAQGRGRGRRHHHQHRHRLARGARAHHRHQRAARGLRLGDAEDEAPSLRPPASPRRWSPATASTRPRWPSRCWPTAAPTWCPWRGRCWPTPTS